MTARSLVFATALIGIALSRAASAQIAPDDSGLGTERGLSQENNSGQAGTVTLFRRGPASTLVVIRIVSEPEGKVEPAHIHRGADCDTLNPVPAYPLAPVINGVSKTLVKASADKLLSGNYDVNVHSAADMNIYFSCGHLYNN